MVERDGMRERIAVLKEETGILAYMRRNGLEKQCDYFNSKATLQKFQEETSFHPQLVAKSSSLKTNNENAAKSLKEDSDD